VSIESLQQQGIELTPEVKAIVPELILRVRKLIEEIRSGVLEETIYGVL
jgi:hypothetical protein